MRDAVHAGYRERLACLADDTVLAQALAAWSQADGWRRTYGRFLPDGEASSAASVPYARLVFEQRRPAAYTSGPCERPHASLVTVDISDARIEGAVGEDLYVASLGWLHVTRFPGDRRLPTLAAALDTPGQVDVVRYRPGRRCTFRVSDRDGVRYGKVFSDDSGRAIHAVGVALDEAFNRGALGCAVAPPIAWDAERRTLWQAQVPGQPLLARLSGPSGVALARRMGGALGTLTTSGVRPDARFDADVQVARTRSYVRELGTRVPALATKATALGEGLVTIHRRRPGRACPIHGAPHVNQWLLDGDRLALVDFDRCSIGNPELDVATFLGELDFEEELTTPVADLDGAFVGAYESTAGPLDPELLRAYRAHKRLAKALRSARALRPDGDARAARHLALAADALEAVA